MALSGLGRTHNLVNSLVASDSASQSIETSSDEDLLRLCAQGNSAALEELVRRYQPPLARILSRLLTSREDVEEALLSLVQQLVAPVDRIAQRSLTLREIPCSAGQQWQAMLKVGQHRLRVQHLDACGGKLDRQR